MPQSFITIRVCLIKPNSGDAHVHLEHESRFENWSVAVSTKSWLIITDDIIYDVVNFRLLCKEYLTLVLKNCRLLFSAVISEHFSKNTRLMKVCNANVCVCVWRPTVSEKGSMSG